MTAAEDLVRRVLAQLAEATADPPGVTRDAYGPGEAAAHAIVEAEARALGAEVSQDVAGNLFMTLPGKDRGAPALLTGSHLDSVPHGGNYDGAAGVVAGLAAMAALRAAGAIPPQDLTVVAFRAEEAAWFPLSYPGAAAALGRLAPAALAARRSDTGRTLAEHMIDAGFSPAAVTAGQAHLDPTLIGGFVEVHIEQGPVLEERGVPLGIVTAINGGFRHMDARVRGAWAHSGATPHGWRRDASVGVADLMLRMQDWWDGCEAAGEALTITFGVLATDPALHGGSRVAGEVRLAVDIRAGSEATLARAADALDAAAAETGAARGVTIEFGPRFDWAAATCDAGLIAALLEGAQALGIPHVRMPSGAGHDSAELAAAGVPVAMVFVRNANGSHNPEEAMEAADLDAAVRLLTRLASSSLPRR